MDPDSGKTTTSNVPAAPTKDPATRFAFNTKSLFGDPEEMAYETINEQHKYLSSKTRGKLPRTSASTTQRGDPTNTTIFNVSEILQGIPEFSSPQETLKRYQDALDTDVALGLKGEGTAADSDFSKYIKTGLLSNDVIRNVDALQATQDAFNEGGRGGAANNAIPGQEITLEMLEKDSRIVYIDPSFKEAAKDKKMHGYLLWLAKLIVDAGYGPLAIVAGIVDANPHGGTQGLHAKGYAMDIRPDNGNSSLVGSPWVTSICNLLDSLVSPRKPAEIAGPTLYAGQGPTKWFSVPETLDRLHIAYTEAPQPEVVDTGGATSGGGAAAIGEVKTGAAPARTTTKGNLELVRVALSQVGDRYAWGAQPNPDDPDPSSFDCSSLVQWACARVGVTDMPRTDLTQRDFCKSRGGQIPIEEAKLTIGALIWKPGHVALSLGENRIVEAPNKDDPVRNVETWFGTEGFKIPGIVYTAAGSAAGTPAVNVSTSSLKNQEKVRNPSEDKLKNMAECLRVFKPLVESEPTIQNKLQYYVAIIESGWTESGWFNNPEGDSTSVGIFQLLAIHGTTEQRMNIEFATRWWFNNAKGAPAKNGKGTAGDLAWQTERPATEYRYRYDTWRNQAVADLRRFNIDASSVDP